MNRPSLKRHLLPAILAASIALGASVAAAESSYDDSDSASNRVACTMIGCGNGNRVCGTYSSTQWIWIPTPWIPIPYLYSETGTCYETPEY